MNIQKKKENLTYSFSLDLVQISKKSDDLNGIFMTSNSF
jgi:hypothetical protein